MRGIIYTKDIYREIVPKIIRDEASWSSFLKFSAIHYQMGFENASLLYAQRPDARMVETYAGWREKGRYVRKGSKGIAIIDSGSYRSYIDHVFDITDTNGRGRPKIWRLDKSNEKEMLTLLHAKSVNAQDYVKEAVEREVYSEDKKYIENISELCRYNSQNPEHIYDITNAVIQSAQYMAAVRMETKPPPVSYLLPVLATAPRLMVYGLCNTALSVAGQVLMGIGMAFVQYLVFDGVLLPLPDSYEVQLADVEADSGGETEAGTTQRDVVRLGVVSIAVGFSVSPRWLKVLTGFKQREKVSVEYFDTETLEMKEAEMFVEGYKAVLVKDTSFKGLWKVSFTLKEF